MNGSFNLPTILVADQDGATRDQLVQDLRHQGYFVLVAEDETEALEIVRVHSRAIHLLITAESLNGRTLATTLKQYRPKMRALFVTRYSEGIRPDLVRLEAVVASVRECLKPVDFVNELRDDPKPAQRFRVSHHVA